MYIPYVAETSEQLEKYLFLRRGVEYKVLDGFEFEDMDTEMTFLHEKPLKKGLMHEFRATPNEMLNTSFQCTICDKHNLQLGLKKIKDDLNDYEGLTFDENSSIDFDEEGYVIDYDFYVPDFDLYIIYLSTGRCNNVMTRSEDYKMISKLTNDYDFRLLEIIHADFDKIEDIIEKAFHGKDLKKLYGGK